MTEKRERERERTTVFDNEAPVSRWLLQIVSARFCFTFLKFFRSGEETQWGSLIRSAVNQSALNIPAVFSSFKSTDQAWFCLPISATVISQTWKKKEVCSQYFSLYRSKIYVQEEWRNSLRMQVIWPMLDELRN